MMATFFEEVLAAMRRPAGGQFRSADGLVVQANEGGRLSSGGEHVDRHGTMLGGGQYEHGFLIHNPRTGEITASVHKRVPREYPDTPAYPSSAEYHRE
jgi:hypothetical protein